MMKPAICRKVLPCHNLMVSTCSKNLNTGTKLDVPTDIFHRSVRQIEMFQHMMWIVVQPHKLTAHSDEDDNNDGMTPG